MFNNPKRCFHHLEVATRFRPKSIVLKGLVTAHYISPNFSSDVPVADLGLGHVSGDIVYHLNEKVTLGSEVSIQLLNPLRSTGQSFDNQFSSLFSFTGLRLAACYHVNSLSTTCGVEFKGGEIRPRLAAEQRLSRGSITAEIAQTFSGPVVSLSFNLNKNL